MKSGFAVIAAARLAACATAPSQGDARPPDLGFQIAMGITQLVVTTAFDAAVARHDYREHKKKGRR